MDMSAIAQTLSSANGPQDPGFLNDIVKLLWPNIRVAGAKMVKDIVEPMFAQMLPAPLDTLHFEKIDLGATPMHFGKILVTPTAAGGGIKLDLDVEWDGECDIELNAKMMPKIGVEHVKLRGRMEILLCPLTNVIPLIGAAQASFINLPYLKFTYTDAAGVANLSFIDKNIRKIVLSIISSMAVLPNRFLVKLDPTTDFFRAYQHPIGVLRLTVESGAELGKTKEGKNFLKRLVHDEPDCYAKVRVGAGPDELSAKRSEWWQTKTIDNSRHPTWNETRDFIVSDLDQEVTIDVNDKDTANNDDDIGMATIKVRDLLAQNGGRKELALTHNEEPTDSRVTVSGKLLRFVPDAASLTGSADAGQLVGQLTVLVAAARGVRGASREETKPSVRVNWGEAATFRTAIKTDSPGTDIENPSWDQAFRVPLLGGGAGVADGPPVRIALLDGETEKGAVEVPLSEVLRAADLTLEKWFEVGSGAKVRAAVVLRGLQSA
ncbi:hypothetical protein VTJ49DRAFT_3663 [Mycothermus thermophilus]|uniref:C2 domain-containing protein n=1 Tax=Humicola insolens TaxID=85995 RepID=A0ABR3V6Z0_HUMIN